RCRWFGVPRWGPSTAACAATGAGAIAVTVTALQQVVVPHRDALHHHAVGSLICIPSLSHLPLETALGAARLITTAPLEYLEYIGERQSLICTHVVIAFLLLAVRLLQPPSPFAQSTLLCQPAA